MPGIIKPVLLKPGDKIALISPSWGGPFHFPGLLEKAKENLIEILGLVPVEFPTCRMDSRILYENPALRAEDINNAFADPDIKGMICSIGGNDSIRILQYLDTDLILKNPKMIMGFSDSTTFLSYLNSLGMVTFNGPSLMAGWAQMHQYPQWVKHTRALVMDNRARQIMPVFSEYSEGYADWADPSTHGEVKPKQPNPGVQWIQGEGIQQGRLWGGCIEVIDWLRGTPYWPDKDFFNERILFFETSEEKPSVSQVGYILRSLGTMGILNRIQGLLFGRPMAYDSQEKEELNDTILRILKGEFEVEPIPVVTGLDFGHSDPNLIMPLGISFQINCDKKQIQRIESCFKE